MEQGKQACECGGACLLGALLGAAGYKTQGTANIKTFFAYVAKVFGIEKFEASREGARKGKGAREGGPMGRGLRHQTIPNPQLQPS